RYRRYVWEIDSADPKWIRYQATPDGINAYEGQSHALLWEDGGSRMARLQGQAAWGRPGVAIKQVRRLDACLYQGSVHASSVGPIVPHNPEHVAAIWAFCQSGEYEK